MDCDGNKLFTILNMVSTCFHQDEERRTVSVTAHGVAYLRSLESILHPDDALFDDPYAADLGGEIGKQWMDSLSTGQTINGDQHDRYLNMIAIRTRQIDDTMVNILQTHPSIRQICVLGAGLDTRPWRIKPTTSDTEQNAAKYFEVDFPELFAYKLPILHNKQAQTAFSYHFVEADLCLSDWISKLESKGFDRNQPTLWLLEGLTNYLTEEELRLLFSRINEASASGSYLVATFLSAMLSSIKLSLHRYLCDDPLVFVNEYGWEGKKDDMEDIAVALHRPSIGVGSPRGYFLVTVSR